MRFEKKINIHFDQCDPAGVVFFANHFQLAHQAIEGFVVHQGIPWQDWFQAESYGVPLIHAEADYKTPMWQGRAYKAKVELKSMGNSSLTFETSFVSPDEQLCSRVQTIHVFIDTKTLKKRPIPIEIRKKLEKAL